MPKSTTVMEIMEPEEVPKTESQILTESALSRAEERRNRFKRRWPSITKPALTTRPWHPPGPPRRPEPIRLLLPELKTRRWVPPYRRRRRRRARLPRIPPDQINGELYECNKLKKIWHNFAQVDRNKMMLQGIAACNSKRYLSTTCGAQTACIAVVTCALLNDKPPSELTRQDVDELVNSGDKFYRQCLLALKCYKGKPQLELKQLLTSFFFHDNKYSIKLTERDRGILAKPLDSVVTTPDLLTLMNKLKGTTYMCILTMGDKNFLIWGHPPPPEAGSACQTVCYIFDPHMQNNIGQPITLESACCGIRPIRGGGAFLRYAGISSFVMDFVANYGNLDEDKRHCPMPPVMLTDIEVMQRVPLLRTPYYEVDLKALPTHCESEWISLNNNALIDRKQAGEFPLHSLSAISLATSRTTSRRKLMGFFQKVPKETSPPLPVAPEAGPAAIPWDHIMSERGEDFFLHCPRPDGHKYGRDDMIPPPKMATVLHSVVDIANKMYHSQFQKLDDEKWILRGTRHMASHRYQLFKYYTGIPCCLAALGMLRRLRARGWNEDTVDETLDLGYNVYRESLMPRGGPIRRVVLGEMAESFSIRDKQYIHKEQGIAVWGKLLSNNPMVFDLCRGLDQFFKTADAGILQVPGQFETAIWNEGGVYYLYHPWPADRNGVRVGLREGGKACLLCFATVAGLCEHFLVSTRDMRRKPFSISAVSVTERPPMPEPVNELKPVAPNRWVVRGSFHEGDARFSDQNRDKQATPTAITAIAMAEIVPLNTWTKAEVDETLVRGDSLYESTIEHLERLGVSLDTEGEAVGEGEELSTGTLAAIDVMNKFRISDFDCIETLVLDSAFSGSLVPTPGVAGLRDCLQKLFEETPYAVVTARGSSVAVFRADNQLYMFDPHGCDENGYLSDDVTSTACLVCVGDSVNALADAIESNLPPGKDDSFNISPVEITAMKLNVELGAPEPKLESNAFVWLRKGGSAIMAGPRGEHSAVGRCATKAMIGDEDQAGRTLALPAVAAFAAATFAVPPTHMHQDHMYNFLDAGTEYYLNHVRKTGNKNITVEDLTEKFEMGANTFSIELAPSTRLPLRLTFEMEGEGEGGGGDEVPGEEKDVIKEIKHLLTKMWNDNTKATQVALLLGDYHQLGVWMSSGGPVVVFDPAPTMGHLMLTTHRIQKGDELRLQRIKDEMVGEEGEDDDEEAGGEGEQEVEVGIIPVPREASPMLMVFASPDEFIDQLTNQGPLSRKQCLAPYWVYPVKVTNELTSVLKDTRTGGAGADKGEGEALADEGQEGESTLVDPLSDEAIGKYMVRVGRAVASLRGRVAQHENYFMEPARGNQDAAISAVAIVVDHIEPYLHWKPVLIDAIVKYGDRLYTSSLPNARSPPRVKTNELETEFQLTSFNAKIELGEEAVTGDLKAGDTGSVLNVQRGIAQFLEANKYGIICAKDYCVAIWRGMDDKSVCMFDPHSVGPNGKGSPIGGAGLIAYSTLDALADTYKANVEALIRPGNNRFIINSITVQWDFAKPSEKAPPISQIPDASYECKVLTAFTELAPGRTILRGSRPTDPIKFHCDAILQSAASAIVGACLSRVRKPHLWTRTTVDQVISEGSKLFASSVNNLGYEFRPGDDVLLPLQVLKRFILGSNYVRFDLQELYSGPLEPLQPTGAVTLKSSIDYFFERRTLGVVWCSPFAAAVWRAPAAPRFYMLEPHAAGPTGLRTDGKDPGAPCVLTFPSSKLLAFAFLQNYTAKNRLSHVFHLYNMSVIVKPIKKLTRQPPLVRSTPTVKLVPATSKIGVDKLQRRASEADRKHPPGDVTCTEVQRAIQEHEKDQPKLKGRRNANGWLVLQDGSQYLSARHSIACRNFTQASRGNQAIACCVMAVAMSRVLEICHWCASTLDAILLSGDQLYQDSYLHYHPKGTSILQMEQILRKFYTPGNCVCRVVIFQPRQEGQLDTDLETQLSTFFEEERSGVLVTQNGEFAVALFKKSRGFYMFDPADRDRYGRAVPPPCIGHARACFSQYPTKRALAKMLGDNAFVPDAEPAPEPANADAKETAETAETAETTEDPSKFTIYGMEVSDLRRLNRFEK